MLLVFHILISFATIIGSILGKAKPTIILLVSSVVSGLALVAIDPARLGHFCLSGLALSLISLTLLRVRQLAREPVQ